MRPSPTASAMSVAAVEIAVYGIKSWTRARVPTSLAPTYDYLMLGDQINRLKNKMVGWAECWSAYAFGGASGGVARLDRSAGGGEILHTNTRAFCFI